MEEEEDVDFNDMPDLMADADPKPSQKKVEDNIAKKVDDKNVPNKSPT